MSPKLVTELVGRLEKRIELLPEGFYDTFEYTRTGQNLTHPVTVGLLAAVVAELAGVAIATIDHRLNNRNGTAFQPDILAVSRELNPVLAIDYESPNSSDARVPRKDWAPYACWRATGATFPYYVITTLPDAACPTWELRYASPRGCNHGFAPFRAEIRRNPFAFWYAYYGRESAKHDLTGITMLNISWKNVTIVPL